MWGCLRGRQSGDPKAAAASIEGRNGPLNPSLYPTAAVLLNMNGLHPDTCRRSSGPRTCGPQGVGASETTPVLVTSQQKAQIQYI